METNVKLFAHLLTALPLDTPQQLADVLTRLCGHVPLPQPYYFGDNVPPTIPWDLQSILSVASQIVQPSSGWYHWQRAEDQESGRVSTGLSHLHGAILMRAQATPPLAACYVRFIREESVDLTADIAFIHISYEDRPLRQDEPEYVMSHAMSTVQLRRGLPDLAWATVFGQPYIEMFGRDRLLTTPAAQVSEMGNGSIYVQLTHTCERSASQDLDRIRNAAKLHLGIDAFRSSGLARVPAFKLQPPPGPRILGWVNGLPVTGMIAGKPIVQTDHGPKVVDAPFDAGQKDT